MRLPDLETLLYCEIHLFALCVTGVILFLHSRQGDRTVSERWFRRALLPFSALFVTDTVLRLIFGPAHARSGDWSGWAIYFILFTLCCFVWSIYSETRGTSGKFPDRKLWSLLRTVLLVNTILSISVLIGSHLVDGFGSISFFIVEILLLVILLVTTSARILSYSADLADANQRHVQLVCAAVPGFLLGGLLLACIFQNPTLADLPITISLLLYFMDATSRRISTDKLTGLNNRQYLMSFVLQEIQAQKDPKNDVPQLFLLMIDVDFFKQVNDRYGHEAGDQALVRIADVLKTSCACYPGRAFLARFGGDEFIIVCEAEEAEAVEDLRKKIHMTMNQFNIWAFPKADRSFDPDDPLYNLQLSIGIGQYRDGMTPVDLLKEADQDLYRIKKEHHALRKA